MTLTLETPAGSLKTSSRKAWHVVAHLPTDGLCRVTSTDTRERGLAAWRRVCRAASPSVAVWLISADGEVIREREGVR